MAILINLAIVTGSIFAWLITVALVVPVVLILIYGRVETRSKLELRKLSIKQEPRNKNYPALQEWTDSRGHKHDVDFFPRAVIGVTAIFAPVFLPLSLIMIPVWIAIRLIRWEADKLNGRIDIQNEVKKMILAQEEEMKKLVETARLELEENT